MVVKPSLILRIKKSKTTNLALSNDHHKIYKAFIDNVLF